MSKSIPMGYNACSLAISRSTPLPSATTLPPSRMEIASAMAGAPDVNTLLSGGSTYPREIAARSSR